MTEKTSEVVLFKLKFFEGLTCSALSSYDQTMMMMTVFLVIHLQQCIHDMMVMSEECMASSSVSVTAEFNEQQ